MNREEKFLNELKQAVLDNLENEQFGVEQLSQIAGMSRSHLHRRLKKLKGQSISRFIREIRLTEALQLLHQDVASTSEIAYRVGFNSPSYFHKCFLEYYGYPPSEARHQFQNQSESKGPNSKTDAESPVDFKEGKKIVSINYKTISFSIIVILLAAYFVFYFLKKDTVSAPVEKSIAVLPFKNLSEDEANQHFADGLVEDLLNRLALIVEFKVISRTSSDAYRERGDKTAPEIASKLGVSYIVEGSVQKYDNKARITVQLIDAKNDDHIWIKSFDRDLRDIFKIQSEIAMQVASHISTVLTEQQAIDIQKNQTENVKAFELYQLGRFYWNKRNQEEYKTAIYYFEQAIAEDPEYALPYAGLADTYFLMTWGFTDTNEIIKYRNKAEEQALKALALDERLAEALTVIATLNFFIDWDWAAAEKTFLRAFEFNPNYSTLHHRYSEHLSITGRHKEARNHINKAIELDPLSFVIRRVSTWIYFNQGLFHEALAEAQICEELSKGHISPAWFQFMINYLLGDATATIKSVKRLDSIFGYHTTPNQVDSVYEASGLNGLIRWEIELSVWPLDNVEYYAFLGEYDKAMDLLEEELEKGNRGVVAHFLYSFRNQHSNPRFIAILNKMNLPWEPEPSQ